MGKRYYCDYCDRHFADSPVHRKKHVNGIQHMRNRKLHYDSFKDPAQFLAEEAQKLPCKKFFQTGSCDFGLNCRYSHTNTLLLLEQQAKTTPSSSQHSPEPKLSEWLAKWEKNRKHSGNDQASLNSKKNDEENITQSWVLPPNLPPIALLPPSLLPPPPGGYPELPKVEWG